MITEDISQRLAGRVALITGASRGIGLAVARRLAAEGASVCLTARGAEGLAQAAATFQTGRALGVAGRAHVAEDRARTLEAIESTYGRLDILVNNAGTNPTFGDLVDLPPTAARKILDVNLLSGLAWVQDLARRPGLGFMTNGAIVNTASYTGRLATPGLGMYGVSKAAVIHLTSTLARELAPGVRVNAIAPAVVRTEFARKLYEEDEVEVVARYPLGRLGEPADIAATVAFLSSDDASWITGQTIVIDGGLSCSGGVA